jgi:hypothetical protein
MEQVLNFHVVVCVYRIWYTHPDGMKPKPRKSQGRAIWGSRKSGQAGSGDLLSHGGGRGAATGLAEGAFVGGSEAHWGGHQNSGVRLADWDARLQAMDDGIYEVRSSLAQNRIARVLFYMDKKGRMVLLHGFIKKTRKTPDEDLDLARRNKKKHQRGL